MHWSAEPSVAIQIGIVTVGQRGIGDGATVKIVVEGTPDGVGGLQEADQPAKKQIVGQAQGGRKVGGGRGNNRAIKQVVSQRGRRVGGAGQVILPAPEFAVLDQQTAVIGGPGIKQMAATGSRTGELGETERGPSARWCLNDWD